MTLFLRRFFGALVFDPAAFEEIESNRASLLHAMIVVALAAGAGGAAAMGLGLTGVPGLLIGVATVLGAWLVWITVVAVIGTITFAEPETHSSFSELVRTLGFAMAPGVFIAFAAMRAVAPIVIALVVGWSAGLTVLAMRQALDYRSTTRAVIVSIVGWLLAIGVIGTLLFMFSETVSGFAAR